ncbi:hypothetical protein PHET_09557 [Paragonimus heterotremus]|uniref:Uncharacterized protein n=1 Tax=Paragonimus heterotremus TaxID=100268 RepID=A0A8J4WSP0_9TREM|nr:hypothetical protein PHET_09557 [Paragonimus heterotremus]
MVSLLARFQQSYVFSSRPDNVRLVSRFRGDVCPTNTRPGLRRSSYLILNSTFLRKMYAVSESL